MQQFLGLFPKPSHYAGIETGAVHKNPQGVNLHVALAFPDTYEVGMSYLGQKILYEIANAHPDWLAERVMAPEKEICTILRQNNSPLATLESDTPLNKLGAVCFSVTHELCYTDILNMLDLAQIPLRAHDRPEDILSCPIVMAGGGAMLGAEPLAPFLDMAVLGDGEEVFPEILALLEKARKDGISRREFLLQAAAIEGVYVPAFFQESPNGQMISPTGHTPRRRIVKDLDATPYPIKQIAPIGAVHNRLSLEIARGCTRGCRFCHAGMIYRPVRERKPETVAQLIDQCLGHTGYDEVSFLALSAGDCSCLKTIYEKAFARCQQEQIALALPSLRVGSVDDEIMAKMASLRRVGCTLAPEAGSQRLRDVINKGVTEEELLLHLAKLIEHGWRQVKLYFMIGLPTETDEDLQAIIDLAQKARDAGGPGAPRLQVTVAVSPFVPKPFTPFQWDEQIALPEMERRINLLRTAVKGIKGIKLKWHEPAASHLEGILSRGDRKLADVVEKAFHKGAIFCSWAESFSLEPWLEAMEECRLCPADYIGKRDPGKSLPWSHLDGGISEEFLWREHEKAWSGQVTPDCRFGRCSACGVCARAKDQAQAVEHKLVFNQRDQTPHSRNLDENGRLLLRNFKSDPPRLAANLTQKNLLLRCWHYKRGLQGYLSHLELQAILMRVFRRANVPVAFSQGFHPLPLLSFGRALPVGTESQAEWFDIWLHDLMAPNKVMTAMNRFLDKNLQLTLVEKTETKAELPVAEAYAVRIKSDLLGAAVDLFAEFAARDNFFVTRQTKKGEKSEDLRPFLLNWHVEGNPQTESNIQFCADWSQKYISPLLLARSILAPLQLDVSQLKLVKLKQIFFSGREYGPF